MQATCKARKIQLLLTKRPDGCGKKQAVCGAMRANDKKSTEGNLKKTESYLRRQRGGEYRTTQRPAGKYVRAEMRLKILRVKKYSRGVKDLQAEAAGLESLNFLRTPRF